MSLEQEKLVDFQMPRAIMVVMRRRQTKPGEADRISPRRAWEKLLESLLTCLGSDKERAEAEVQRLHRPRWRLAEPEQSISVANESHFY